MAQANDDKEKDKDEERRKQEQLSSSSEDIVKKDAWTGLLVDYHKATLSAWDFAIDLGATWLKAQAHLWSPDYFRDLYRETRKKQHHG